LSFVVPEWLSTGTKVMDRNTIRGTAKVTLLLAGLVLVGSAVSILLTNVLRINSHVVPNQGHRKQFLSIQHHLCSHRFFQSGSRARSSTENVYPYIRNGVAMELGVLAATTKVGMGANSVTRFEALIFSSKRNYSKSVTGFHSHCASEVCEFTDLMCVVNGQASRATVHSTTFTWLPPLQSVLMCDIKANASADFVVKLSSPGDSLQATLHLCALNQRSAAKVVGCAQPWMDAHSLERRYPGLHRAYVLFVLAQTSCWRHFLQPFFVQGVLKRV